MFELRPVENGFELRGGELPEPMIFRDVEPRPAVHLVGFLSQKRGSKLRIFNAEGEVIEKRQVADDTEGAEDKHKTAKGRTGDGSQVFKANEQRAAERIGTITPGREPGR